MFRPPDGSGRVHREELAQDHPVEQHPDGRQVLLDRGPGTDPAGVLHPSGHMDRFHLGELVHPVLPTPGGELADRAVVGAPGIRVRDLRGEELPKASGSFLRSEERGPAERPGPSRSTSLPWTSGRAQGGFRRLELDNRRRISHGSEYT